MNRPAKPDRLPRLAAAVRLQVWLCVVWVALAGLLSVSPALHGLFCAHEHARSTPACLAHDSCAGHDESKSPRDHASGEHRCAVAYFQTGFDCAVEPSGVLALSAPRDHGSPSASAPAPLSTPRGLHPPGNGPPLVTA